MRVNSCVQLHAAQPMRQQTILKTTMQRNSTDHIPLQSADASTGST